MSIRVLTTVLACVVPIHLAGCWYLPGTQCVDKSQFRRFEIRRTKVLDVCVPIGEVYSASIELQSLGTFVRRMAVLSAIDDDWDPVLTDLPARELSPDEVEQLRAIFSMVEFKRDIPLICFGVIDPCMITYFVWDQDEFSDFACSRPYLTAATVQGILDFVDGLR